MKRILWFANTPCGAVEYLTGKKVTGTGSWLYAMSQAISKDCGYDLHIAFYWHNEMTTFNYDGITYHPILREGFGNSLARYLYRFKQQFSSTFDRSEIDRVESVINQIAPDLIHFHGTEENFGLVSSRIKDIPMVLSIQGILAPILNKFYSGYSKEEILRNESFFPKIIFDGFSANERRMKIRVRREQQIYSNINHIIGRTEWDRDCSLSFNPDRKYYICNEVLRTSFLENKWNRQPITKFVLTTTMSNGLFKGLETVYKTAELLSHKKINFEWRIIGLTKNDRFPQITRRITDIEPDEVNIVFVGSQNADEMVDTLKHSNAYVQVSHIENSPNSLCEAMAMGMPIIGTCVGGTSSMLENNEEGILIQDGDPYRLSGAIINMMMNYDQAVMMGESARNRAINRHLPQNVVKELISIYNIILDGK